MTANALCRIDDIPENGSLGIQFKEVSLFAVRADNEIHVYLNSCPHLGLPLEWQEHEFLNEDNSLIQCKTHGALFEIASGLCVQGPCLDQKLHPVKITIENDLVYIDNEC
jgi:nitrite reductase/ring-hydroxylating ferredoxin subunit